MRVTRRDGKALIAKFDVADQELIDQYTWHLQVFKNTGYAETVVWREKPRDGVKQVRHIYMSHLILGGGNGRVNHLNGNGMDCRRGNIAFSSQSQILAKRRPVGGASKYKGVALDKGKSTQWVARFRGKNLGRFNIEEDAARAFDDAAFEYWGHQAYFNFPDEVADWEWVPPPAVDTD